MRRLTRRVSEKSFRSFCCHPLKVLWREGKIKVKNSVWVKKLFGVWITWQQLLKGRIWYYIFQDIFLIFSWYFLVPRFLSPLINLKLKSLKPSIWRKMKRTFNFKVRWWQKLTEMHLEETTDNFFRVNFFLYLIYTHRFDYFCAHFSVDKYSLFD